MAVAPYGDLRRGDAGTPRTSLLELLREELALRPHRLLSAIRAATVASIGAGIMAAAHVDSALGPYLVWILAGTPTAMLRWRTAVTFTIVEGATIAIAVVFARVLSQSPILMLATLAVFAALATYAIARFKLGAFGLVTEVLVFDSFYSVMFGSGEIGWNSAATFGGFVIGVGLIFLFDNWFWPDPAERILLESLQDNLRRVRLSLTQAARNYLAESPASGRPPILSLHETSANLTLLARAQAEGISEPRRALLIGAITRISRLHSRANELMVANDRRVPRNVRRLVAPEIQAVFDAIDAVIDEVADDFSAIMPTAYSQPLSPARIRVESSLASLEARVSVVRPSYLATAGAAELSNFGFFLSSLRAICRAIEHPLEGPALAGPAAPANVVTLDPAMAHYCLKVALSLVIGYVIGLLSQRPDLSTVLTTIIITALPTYGAAARKMIQRFWGSLVGGAMVIVMVIVVSPNFESLPVYIMVLFVTLLISGYTGQGSERFAYAGKQIGTVVMLAYAGLSPSVAVEPPLWRIWSILLGTGVVLVVSLTLWPEYAAESLPSRLRQLLRLTLALAPGAVVDRTAMRRTEVDLNNVLEQTLAVADDARLEGHASKLNPDPVVRTAGNLRRIAHHFEAIALTRIEHSRPELDRETENAARVALDSIIAQLKLWLAWIESPAGIEGPLPDAQANQSAMTHAMTELNESIQANSFARLNGWQFDERRILFNEIESLRRLSLLMNELDDYLAQVPVH